MNKTIFTEEHKHIIRQLKKARLESGFDQAKVAELLGKTQSYVSKIESGQRRIDIVTLKNFAEVYKKNINFFLK